MALKSLHPFLVVLFLLHMSMSVAITGLKCKVREREALLSLKHGFVDDDGRLSSWGNGECCEWEGISCSKTTGHVVKLDLHVSLEADPLGGMINSSLAKLHHLKHLDLSGNSFDGDMPQFIGSLAHLKYLDLSNSFQGGRVPHEFGNLSRLQYLDLSYNSLDGDFPAQLTNLSRLILLDLYDNYFTGTVPHQLGNLSRLQYLQLSGVSPDEARSDLVWLSSLSSLRILALDSIDLSSANNWLLLATNLPHLRQLALFEGILPNPDIAFLSDLDVNISTSLTLIDLSYNYNLTSSIFAWVLNYKSSLQVLDLSGNLIHETPVSLWDLCSLREVDLDDNKLSGQLHLYVPTHPHCAHKSLEILHLCQNQITGLMPDLSQLSSLRELCLGSNMINGTLTKSIAKLPKLKFLDVSKNSLQGLVSEDHLSNLSKLTQLDLSHNSLVLNLSDHWLPPFQLEVVHLSSCKVGPHFPTWLRTQKSYHELDMSSAKISDTIPRWFWNHLPRLEYLNLSNNQIRGQIPNIPVESYNQPRIYLSSNFFHGPIPSFFSQARFLVLSYNNFTNTSSLLCSEKTDNLERLDLSHNQLTELPDCWMNLKSLLILDLSNNHLSGQIPATMGFLVNIQALHLHHNNFTKEIPASLNNCQELIDFDVGHNKLSGPVPLWIGYQLGKLVVFILRSNQFYGNLPRSLCFLSRILVLDVSLNNISGSIPSCVKNLTAMSSQNQSAIITDRFHYGLYVETTGDSFADSAWVTWKGKESEYRNTLALLRTIDLSGNNLVGEIPSEIMDLIGLVSLNISRNKLSGEIPSTIGQLKSLDFLDLSRNFLFGRIPSGLSEIDRLGVLDLSYNNLSGKIPVSTQLQSFNASSFLGNSKLCGAPLPKTCPDEETHVDQNHESNTDDNQIVDHGFYISLAVGFIVGFWCACFSLIFIRSWRYAYFRFFNDIHDRVYVLVVVNYVKARRKFEGIKNFF